VVAGGHNPWAYKVGNLFLHLTIGALMGVLAAQVLRRDPRLADRALPVAAAVALLWLALPVHASTVLYPVQRMTQMSALFVVLGLIAYIALRERIDAGRGGRWPAAQLVGVVACFTLLGGFSKENGLLLPLLCLVVEFAVFQRDGAGRRAATVALALLVGLPAVLGVAGIATAPDRLFGAYEARSFTLLERVLTQPRVLWDYVASILLPNGGRLGVYQDDFPLSRSLWSPITTLPAIAAWMLVVALAVRLRHVAPVATCGVLFFLAAHAMESTVLPLEIYFEHRNYLPAIGLLLAVAAGALALLDRLRSQTTLFRRTLPALPALVLLALMAATHGRALVWGEPEALMAQSVANRPESPRVQSELAARAMASGDLAGAMAYLDTMQRLSGPIEAGSIALWRITAHCLTGVAVTPETIEAAHASLQPRPTTFGLRAAIVLAERVEGDGCPGFDAAQAAALYAAWSEALETPPTQMAAWRVRYLAARLAALAGQWSDAVRYGEQAWRDSNGNTGIGVFLIQIANSIGNREMSARYTADLDRRAPAWDLRLREAVERFRQHLDERTPATPAG
jgi:hypothetical protein